jgi:hypothetical protein
MRQYNCKHKHNQTTSIMLLLRLAPLLLLAPLVLLLLLLAASAYWLPLWSCSSTVTHVPAGGI